MVSPGKLNASASAFVPASTINPNSVTSSFGNKTPSSSTNLDKVALPLSQNAITAPTLSFSEVRSPLQARYTSPTGQKILTSRKVSNRQPSITKTLDSIKPKKQAMIPGLSRMALAQALPELLDNLLSEYLDSLSRKVAVASLSATHAQQQAQWDAERQLVIEQCSADLVDAIFEQAAGDSAKEVVAQYLEKRNELKPRMRQWRSKLIRVLESKKVHSERRRRFDDLAQTLNVSPRKGVYEETASELPDISLLDLDDNIRNSSFPEVQEKDRDNASARDLPLKVA